jgi:hypothetical protein
MSAMWGLVDDVQRMAMEAAGVVLDQFRSTAGRMRGRADATGAAGGAQPEAGWRIPDPAAAGPDVKRMMDAWVGLMQASWSAFASFVQSTGSPMSGSGATADEGVDLPTTRTPAPAGADQRVDLPTTVAGSTVVGQLWVRNTSAEAAGGVALVASDLVDGAGHRLAAAALTFDPAVVDSVGPGESLRVALQVAVPPNTADGTYHGVVLATTQPPSVVVLSVPVSAGE